MGACMNSKESKKNPVAAFFGAIGKFFKEFGEAAAKGDGACLLYTSPSPRDCS